MTIPDISHNDLPPVSRGGLADETVRAELSAGGFRTFLALADRLGLSVAERRTLLGGVPATTYHHWKAKGAPTLAHDTLERISLVLGIWKGLKLLFADEAHGVRWLNAGNRDLPFAGDAPLATMLRGSIDDLYGVRRYLDGWRGVWP